MISRHSFSNAGHSGLLHEGYSHVQAGMALGRPPTLLLARLLPLGPRARRFAARCFLFLWPLLGGLLPGWAPSQSRCRSAGSGLEAIDLPVQLHHQRLGCREGCSFIVRHVAAIWPESPRSILQTTMQHFSFTLSPPHCQGSRRSIDAIAPSARVMLSR